MGFIADNLVSHLRHSSEASFLLEETLRYCIWYSPTKEAYSQRTTVFDGSWLEAKCSNAYVFLAIKKYLGLASLKGFDNMDMCHNEIDSLSSSSDNRLYMYYNKAKKASLFTAFVESLRNGLAHGSFNLENDQFFLISQHAPKPESPVKFYLQVGNDFDAYVLGIFKIFEKMKSNPLEEKYNILTEPLKLKKIGDRYYSEHLGQFVLIDDNFSFATNSRVAEIQNRLQSSPVEENTIVFVNEKLSVFADKNLRDETHNTRMASIDSVLEEYQSDIFG